MVQTAAMTKEEVVETMDLQINLQQGQADTETLGSLEGLEDLVGQAEVDQVGQVELLAALSDVGSAPLQELAGTPARPAASRSGGPRRPYSRDLISWPDVGRQAAEERCACRV